MTGIYHPVLMVARFIKGNKDELTALDVACGSGETSCFLAKLGCKVTAIELTKKRTELLNVSDKVDAKVKNIDGWTQKVMI